MGSHQAASTLAQVRAESARARGEATDPADIESYHQGIVDRYEHEGSPYFGTARLWDDGIVDPLDTRRVVALALAVCRLNPGGPSQYGVFRM